MEPTTGPIDPTYDSLFSSMGSIGLCLLFLVLVFLFFRAMGGRTSVPLPPPPDEEDEED